MARKVSQIKYFQVSDLILNNLDWSILPGGDFYTDVMNMSDWFEGFFIEGYRELTDGNVKWTVEFSNDKVNWDVFDAAAQDLGFPDGIFMSNCYPKYFRIFVDVIAQPNGGLTLFATRVNQQ